MSIWFQILTSTKEKNRGYRSTWWRQLAWFCGTFLSAESQVMARGWQVRRRGPKGGCFRHREEPCGGAEGNPGNIEKAGMTGARVAWRTDVEGEYMKHTQVKSGRP